MAASPLVADISPLLDSLRQFTPAAREDRRLQLAGLGQAEDLRQSQIDINEATLEEKNLANKRNQIISVAEESRVNFLGEISDIEFVIKDGPEGVRNNIALLVKDKGDLSDEEMQEFIGVANMAVENKEGAFKMLEGNLTRMNQQLGVVDDILSQTRSRGNAALALRESLLKDLKSPDEEVRSSAARALRLEGPATGAAPQVIMIGGVPHIFDKQTKTVVPVAVSGSEVTVADVAATEATIAQERAAGTARGKAIGEAATGTLVANTRAKIETAVKLAGAEASARGETLTDLARAEAALPGLQETMDQLRELAPIVTSTFAGKIFDTAVRESGFGSTKGATAKAKFIAIINNQVLPLLKPTFGAAFTEREGEALKATMGDPDASPAQKIAQIDAFIAQKIRDIEGKRRELTPQQADPSAQVVPEGTEAINPQTGAKLVMINGTWQPAP